MLLSGCIILPIPHKRIHQYGVTGQVIDARSETPVQRAIIRAADKPNEVILADEKGYFTIKPVFGWHGAYYISPIVLSLFPAMDMPSIDRTLKVQAPGYQEKQASFTVTDTTSKVIGPERIPLKRE